MNNRKNAFSSIILHLATIIQGLIIPKVILMVFGSNVNGLILSITQFLGFISLLEGGLGAVVLAELYKPIEVKDDGKIKSILKACQAFFIKLALCFFIYTLIIAIIYPLYITKDFSFCYISSLVLILSMTTVSQYMLSITYRLLLQAEQKIYIVNYISSFTILLNTFLTVAVVCILPDIHVVKLASGIIYFIQPLIYTKFVKNKFHIKRFSFFQKNIVFKNRWSGFSQNLAHFINMNTDIILITLFMPLHYVSIYSIHMLVINALRGLIVSLASSYQSALGKYIAIGDIDDLKQKFEKYENKIWLISIVTFSCCILLINQFIQLYTYGVNDAVYYQPIFALILVIANMIYVIREPYRLLILAAGKFRETNFGAIIEALINIIISIVLICRLGILGVAIGTLVAIVFRFAYFLWYLSKDIIKRKYMTLAPNILMFLIMITINLYIYCYCKLNIDTFFHFLFIGSLVFIFESTLCVTMSKLAHKIIQIVDTK